MVQVEALLLQLCGQQQEVVAVGVQHEIHLIQTGFKRSIGYLNHICLHIFSNYDLSLCSKPHFQNLL